MHGGLALLGKDDRRDIRARAPSEQAARVDYPRGRRRRQGSPSFHSLIDWDAENERITNHAAANELLHYECRKPWTLDV